MPDVNSEPKGLDHFLFFESKVINFSVNKLENKNQSFSLFDLSYSEGAFITKEDLKASFLLFDSPVDLPVFVLDKEDFKSNLYHWADFNDVNFSNHPDFSRRFHLSGDDQKALHKLFSPELIFFFESHPIFHLESNGSRLLIKGKDRLSSIQEIKIMLAFAKDLCSLLGKDRQT